MFDIVNLIGLFGPKIFEQFCVTSFSICFLAAKYKGETHVFNF